MFKEKLRYESRIVTRSRKTISEKKQKKKSSAWKMMVRGSGFLQRRKTKVRKKERKEGRVG